MTKDALESSSHSVNVSVAYSVRLSYLHLQTTGLQALSPQCKANSANPSLLFQGDLGESELFPSRPGLLI